MEDDLQKGIGKELPAILTAYREVIEQAGYEFGVYTGLSFYNTYIKPYALPADIPFWIARYPSGRRMELADSPPAGKKPEILHPLWGWQYSSSGTVPGIQGTVDLDIMYGLELEKLLHCAGANPYEKPPYILYRFRTGMKPEHVKWLQYELNERGCGLRVDGCFGAKTDAALRRVQKELGTISDGKCGSDTKKRLAAV